MKNKDTILLENAYQSVYNESEYTIDNRDPFTSDLTTAEGVTISVDIWELVENAQFPFITGVGNPLNSTDASFVMSFNKTDIGIGSEDIITFNFVVTYMDAFGGNGVFRSDEGYGSGLPTGNPGTADVTFTSSEVYDSTLNLVENNFNAIKTNLQNNSLIVEGLNGNASIELFNLLGQNMLLVKNVAINNSATFNLGNVSKGIYLARISFEGQVKTFKLVNR